MTEHERNKIIDTIKGMSEEELEVVVNAIPVELCLDRIKKEINKSKVYEDAIKSNLNLLTK